MEFSIKSLNVVDEFVVLELLIVVEFVGSKPLLFGSGFEQMWPLTDSYTFRCFLDEVTLVLVADRISEYFLYLWVDRFLYRFTVSISFPL